jgi:superfamily II DNA/RNA helicase
VSGEPAPFKHYRALVHDLWPLALSLYANPVARERGYVVRAYQIKAAVRAVAWALAGRNSAIELPTGTGKTLIACMTAVLGHQVAPGTRTWLIVPSRTLVIQHFEVARWIATSLIVDRLTDEHAGDPGAVRRTLLRSQFVISTPGILANALGRRVIESSVVATVTRVIVDEFDQFVVVEESERHSVARYGRHWQRLLKYLPPTTRFLIKSATLGSRSAQKAKGNVTKAARRFVLITKQLNPAFIHIPEKYYAAVIPYQRLHAVTLTDARIAALLQAVSTAKGRAHLALEEAVGPVDYADVERQAPFLCDAPAPLLARLRCPDGKRRSITLTAANRQHFCRITGLLMMPQHLLEDLTLGLHTSHGRCKIKTPDNTSIFLEGPRLRDDRQDNHFRFERGGKADAALSLAQLRPCERGVVFVRTVTLLNGLWPLLAMSGRALFQLTGEMRDLARRNTLLQFQHSESGLLLMTRTTGGRGLDLPSAHFSIFYSPKTEPDTLWQEMSRIRSTVAAPKDIYILCYGSLELKKLEDVVAELKTQGRQVTLDVETTSSE